MTMTKKTLFILLIAALIAAEMFAAAPRPGWIKVEITSADGSPQLVAQTRRLPFVQFFDFYHPFERHALLPEDSAPHDLTFSLSNVDGAQETINAISAVAAAGSVQADRYEHDIFVRAHMAKAEA